MKIESILSIDKRQTVLRKKQIFFNLKIKKMLLINKFNQKNRHQSMLLAY